MDHVMVDIESLGTKVGSIILSIGAVKFDIDAGLGEEFYVVINTQNSREFGLTDDPSTVQWWGRQSHEARAVIREAANDKESLPLNEALDQFTRFVVGLEGSVSSKMQVWGNGANFDNVLIAAAYQAVGVPYPARFFNDCCFRTLRKIVTMTRRKPTLAHHALADAKAQALDAVDALRKLRDGGFNFIA